MPIPKNFTIGPECLIGYASQRLIALPARTTNVNQSIGMKFQWKNGKMTQFFFVQYTLIIRDLFIRLALAMYTNS